MGLAGSVPRGGVKRDFNRAGGGGLRRAFTSGSAAIRLARSFRRITTSAGWETPRGPRQMGAPVCSLRFPLLACRCSRY